MCETSFTLPPNLRIRQPQLGNQSANRRQTLAVAGDEHLEGSLAVQPRHSPQGGADVLPEAHIT